MFIYFSFSNILIDCLLSGSILIFLPGYDEIVTLRDKLMDDKEFSKRSNYLILLLHSMIPPSNQRKVFGKPPKGNNFKFYLLS